MMELAIRIEGRFFFRASLLLAVLLNSQLAIASILHRERDFEEKPAALGRLLLSSHYMLALRIHPGLHPPSPPPGSVGTEDHLRLLFQIVSSGLRGVHDVLMHYFDICTAQTANSDPFARF